MRAPEAAVAIVHARRPEESVLLMRRAERQADSWSGHWSLPGGRCEPGDVDLPHTALRELEEECGIRLDRQFLVSALPPRPARRRGGEPLLVAPFVFQVERELAVVVDPREAVEAQWIPLRALLDPARHSLQCVPGVTPQMRYPCIALHGAPLWGFTYRLLTAWLGLIPAEEPSEDPPPEAALIFEFLVSRGLNPGYGPANGAGEIPVQEVMAVMADPAAHVPQVNAVEVRPEYIRFVGLGFEEYFIHAARPPE
jgi:8-oxo-dGTP pyrophosphatase MutT (NUDIX family)